MEAPRHREDGVLMRLCWWGRGWFVGILICQVTLCWPWDGEKRVNVCESSSVQSRAGRMRGRICARCRAERRRGMLGAGC